MRHSFCSIAVALAVASCGRGSVDAGRSADDARVAISGDVYSNLCSTASAATVTILDAPDHATIADTNGHFVLDSVPPRTTLVATAPDHIPTLTSVRSYGAPQVGVEVALVPLAFSDLFHGAAGFALTDEVGTLALGFLDAGGLPVAGVEVELLGEDGLPTSGTSNRRYLTPAGSLLAFDEAGSTSVAGGVAFFEVPPGRYIVAAHHESATFPSTPVELRGASATVELIYSTTPNVGTWSRLTGEVRGPPAFPASGSAGPVAGATVTATVADGTALSTTTGADGTYAFDVPWVRQPMDLTVTTASHYPTRSRLDCAAAFLEFWRFDLGDSFFTERTLGAALGANALDPTAGSVFVTPKAAGNLAFAGATVSIDPPLAAPFYGEDTTQPMRCGIARCDGAEPCPTGSRCLEGECVVGATGPSCDRCDQGTCPAGLLPWVMPRYDTASDYVCYCLETPTACDLEAPTCSDGTYCTTYTSYDASSETWIAGMSACLIHRPLHAATALRPSSNVSMGALFTNVPAGTYTMGGDSPYGRLLPLRVRVTAGVMTALSLGLDE